MPARFGAGGDRGCTGPCSGCAARGITCGPWAPAFAGPRRHAHGARVSPWSASLDHLSGSGTRDKARRARTSPARAATTRAAAPH
eukprot:15452772-Alexandrium_andersonii.AAC.1